MGLSPKSNYEKKKSFLVLTSGKFLEALGNGIGTGSIFCLSFSLSNRVNWHWHIRITKYLNEIQSMITAWKIQQGPWGQSEEQHKTWKLNYETRFLKNCKLSKTDVYEKEDFHIVNRMRQWNARYPKRLDFLILHTWKYCSAQYKFW